MTVRHPRRVVVRVNRDRPQPDARPEKRHNDVPKPVKQATDRFIKKYRTTLRDLEKF